MRSRGFFNAILILSFALVLGTASASDETKTLTHGGIERTYILYAPRSLDPSKKAPLVIALHGGLGSGEKMRAMTFGAFDRLADAEGFIVAYPNGEKVHWNDGREKTRVPHSEADDVGFISALIDRLIVERNVDPMRVYVTGISNGAMMSNRLGCELSAKIAAIAPVAGSMPEALAPQCVPGAPVSVLTINGTKDPLVPYEGGEIRIGKWGRGRGRVQSTDATMAFWAKHNGCGEKPAVIYDAGTSENGMVVRRETYGNCRGGAEANLIAIEGGGHAWPGGLHYASGAVIGQTNDRLNAAKEIWEFFKKLRKSP